MPPVGPIALLSFALTATVVLAGCSSARETPDDDRITILDSVIERAAHTANPLLDGRVLVAGGCVIDGCGEATDTSEVFDPEAETFILAATMTTARSGHSATMLGGGDVLLVGGYSGEGQPPLASAELYDATSGTFVAAGSMETGRGAHAAVLLPDGRVLVAGGWVGSRTFTNSVEIWDPSTRTFMPASPLGTTRGGATATSLATGEVLVVGGENPPARGLRSTEIYDPRGNRWRPGPELALPRFKHATAMTDEGDVLVIGGTTDDVNLIATVERFDGASFQPAGVLTKHTQRYLSGKKGGHEWRPGVHTLLLTTTGRRTRTKRRTPLIYGRDGNDYVVVGSVGGSAKHPAWYLNLSADPHVDVQVGTEEFPAVARTAEGKERARLFEMMQEIWPYYGGYQKKTKREIPVVVLTPVDHMSR